MGHGKNYRGHKPAKVVSTLHPAPHEATRAEQAIFTQFAAIDYLRKHIGGTWRWDGSKRELSAEFRTEIADAICTFFRPVYITCGIEKMPGNTARLTLTPEQFATVQCAPFIAKAKPLAEQYAALLAGEKQIGKGR